MREELVAVVERARELMQGGGERNVLPAGKGGQEQTPCESQPAAEPSRKTEMSCLRRDKSI